MRRTIPSSALAQATKEQYDRMVTEGLANVTKINAEYGENPDQGMITSQGNAYLTAQFPRLDFIEKTNA